MEQLVFFFFRAEEEEEKKKKKKKNNKDWATDWAADWALEKQSQFTAPQHPPCFSWSARKFLELPLPSGIWEQSLFKIVALDPLLVCAVAFAKSVWV